jgi:chromosome partitioning protein
MSVIAVVNRKGGSGKSTLATHIAAYCALRGAAVAIADIDRQQSTRAWLRQRKAHLAGEAMRITAWNVDPRTFVRPPVGIDHVVIDTPGGLTGLDLARVVMYADALVVPIGASIFDRESAAACLAELRTLPRVSSGKCRIGVIGMRLDAQSDSADALLAWSHEHKVQILAVLPQSPAYVRCIDKGQTLFDLPLEEIEGDLAHWKPLLQWLRPLVRPAANSAETIGATPPSSRQAGPPPVDQPLPEPAAASNVKPFTPAGPDRAGQKPATAAESTTSARSGLLSGLSIPSFLTRRS